MKKKKETAIEREHLVVKRNDLIQKSRHQMDLQEQKIVLYLISKIKPDDNNFTEQIFSIAEFCKIIGADHDSGGNYEHVKKSLKSLRDRSVWVTLDDGSETTLAWINQVTINKQSGIVKIRLAENLKPFLLDLQNNFTQYSLIYTLAMRSQYSVRLYELLKSYLYKKRVIFDIDDLKRLLYAEKYENGKDFRIRVLEVGVKEINKFSDIKVEYALTKEGRKFTEVVFVVEPKTDLSERIKAFVNIEKSIDKPKPEKIKKKTAKSASPTPKPLPEADPMDGQLSFDDSDGIIETYETENLESIASVCDYTINNAQAKEIEKLVAPIKSALIRYQVIEKCYVKSTTFQGVDRRSRFSFFLQILPIEVIKALAKK